MKSNRSKYAFVRDTSRLSGRETVIPTLSEDGTLWRISRVRASGALRFRRRTSLTAMARAAGRQVLSLLGLW